MPEYITGHQQSDPLGATTWAQREILRRLDALENYEVDGKQNILSRLDMLELQVGQIKERLEEIGLEIGQIAKIMLDSSAPAEPFTESELDRLLDEIFQGAQSLDFDEALRRAASLRNPQTRIRPNTGS